MASRLDVEFNPPLRCADGTTMETNRSRAWSTRLCLPLVASSVLWATACTSAGNAASSATSSSETPTSPSSTGTASPSAEDGFGGLVYVNQKAGYTFHYPDDWVVVEGKGAGSVVVYAPPGDPRSSPANVSISLAPVAEGTNLKSYYRQTIGFLGVIPGFRLESTRRESFAGFPAFSIAYSLSPKGSTFGALQITTLVGTTAYSAIYSSAPKTYKRYLVDGGLIVRSFQLI
jgi:PsbP